MFELKLTRPPDCYDEYNQPCYPIVQGQGLLENQDNSLFEDALAAGYVGSIANEMHQWCATQVSLVATERKLDLLEIGGGTGWMFEWVKESTNTYVNLDPGHITLDENQLALLKDPRYMGLKCSAENIPLPDESIDIIISNASLDHVPNYTQALAEIKRLLREDGLFVLTLNNRRSWWKCLLSRTDYLKKREEAIAKEHYFQWSYSDCKSYLSNFFTVKQIHTTTFIPYIPKLWHYALPLSNLIGRSFFSMYGSNIIAVCQKKTQK
jgi:ubiquinone/menaquinone biosynthesis C-methylase UbiE